MAVLALLGALAVAWAAAAPIHAAGDYGLPRAGVVAASWTQAADLPQPLTALGMVAVGSHLTVLGGQIGWSQPVRDTGTIALGPDGSLIGSWRMGQMPGPRAQHGSQVYDNVIYILGGGAPEALDNVFGAAVDANGVPFNWTEGGRLPAPRSFAGTAIAGRYLYLAGGWNGTYPVRNEVYVAAIGPDGVLTAWQPTTPLPAVRSGLTLTAANGFVYAIGGSDGSSAQTTVWRAQVRDAGQLGAWEPLAPLPEPRFDHATVFFKGQLVVLGGFANESSDAVFAADVQADGSLGPWQTNASVLALPKPLDRHAAAVAMLPQCGEVLYVAGGRSKGTYERAVYRTNCAPTPTPTATATNTPTVTPTATPTVRTGPWADWRQSALVVRREQSRTVVLDFGNQTPPQPLTVTLLGPVLFKATGNQKLETTVNVMGGSYPFEIMAAPGAQVGDSFYVYANVGPGAAPLLIGTIGRGGFLPVILQGYRPSLTTATPTPSITPSPKPSSTPTSTATSTPTFTLTPSATATSTRTATSTWTPTATFSPSPTRGPSNTPTATSASQGPTFTATPTRTWTPVTPTKTWTPTNTPTNTPTPGTPTPTYTPRPSSTPTWTPSITPTITPSITPSITLSPTPTNTGAPVQTNTPTATDIPLPSDTPTPTNTPGATTWVTLKQEGFEGSFPNDWTVMDNNTNLGNYFWGKRNCRAASGSYSGWAVGAGDGAGLGCGTTYPYGVEAWMKWGPFSLADALAADLQYDVWYSTPNEYDNVWALVSLDNSTWCGYQYYGNVAAWKHGTFDLSKLCDGSSAIGQPQVWMAFLFQSDYAWNNPEGVYVDNILLRKQTAAGSLYVPTQSVSRLDASSADGNNVAGPPGYFKSWRIVATQTAVPLARTPMNAR